MPRKGVPGRAPVDRTRGTIAALLTAAVVGLAVLGYSGYAMFACPPQFDSAAWERAQGIDAEQEPVRRQLASQLGRCGFIDGASEERVREVVGAPIPENEDTETRSWSYYLGDASWGVDSDWLVIEFSRRNRVETVDVRED